MSIQMDIAVVGARGLVGQELIKLLGSYDCRVWPIGRTQGEYCSQNQSYHVNAMDNFDFGQVDGVMMSSGESSVRALLPQLKSAWVVDNSAVFRHDHDIPLVVPEIYQGQASPIVSSPNCVAIPISLVLHALGGINAIDYIWGATYQSVSGAGLNDLNAYHSQLGMYDNVSAKIGDIGEDGISQEERKIAFEICRILGRKIPIEITAVRVPIAFGHSAVLKIVYKNHLNVSKILEKLEFEPYIKLYNEQVPSPKQARRSHQVLVGRVRVVGSVLHLWITSDNVYRGAAWNMVEIAKKFEWVR